MNKFLNFSLFNLLFFACTASPSAQEEQVRQAVERFSLAFQTADVAALSGLLTDDYLHCNNGSTPIGKTAWLDFVNSRKRALDSGALSIRVYRNEEVKIVCYGESAAVTGINIAEGLRDGQPFSTKIRFTHLWVLENGTWKRAGFHDSPFPAQPPVAQNDSTRLSVTFIGNEAFQITDGAVTLLSDYPYKSGAFGYMTYDAAAVQPAGKVLCLVTHEHGDHFSPALWAGKGWHLAASPRIKTPGGEALRLPFSDTMAFEGIRIFAQKTPHTDAHYSYLVEWHGRRFYFPGDTEALDFLPKEKVDVLFITPWLLEIAETRKLLLNAEKVVVYHHREGEKVSCSNCVVPKQGDTWSLPKF